MKKRGWCISICWNLNTFVED